MKALYSYGRKTLPWLGLLLATLLTCAVARFVQTRMSRELAAMPAPERYALYERTIKTLHASCTQASGPELIDYCRQQAAFLERFPECNSECIELTQHFHPIPTR